jgi:putative transcriptional regulator
MKYVINNKVKLLRTSLEISQEKLADIVDVTRLSIISIEKQRYEPSVGLAIRLAKALNSTVEELFWIEKEEE